MIELLCALLSGRAVPWPSGAGPGDDAAFLAAARRADVLPLVAYRLDTLGLRAAWPATIVHAAERARREEQVRDLLRQEEEARVARALDRAGVAALVFKGAALARTVYPAPWLRPRLDTDLLVRETDLDRVAHALVEAEYEEDMLISGAFVGAEQRWVRALGPGVMSVLDVHWRIVNRPEFGDLWAFDELAATAVPLPGWPDSVRALDEIHSLLVGCLHHIVHHGGGVDPLWLCDLHLLAERLGEDGLIRAAEAARQRRIAALCARSLAVTARWFGTSLPHGVRAAFEAERDATGALATYGRSDVRLVDWVWRDLRKLPTWRARLQLAREHLLPPAAYMLRRYGVTRRAWLPLLYLHRAAAGWWRWFLPVQEEIARRAVASGPRWARPRRAGAPARYTDSAMRRGLSIDDVLEISGDVRFCELDGETVLLNLATGLYFGLDQVGTRMWQLIAAHGSLRRVLAALVEEYDAPPERLEADLLRLAGALCRKGLVRPAGAADTPCHPPPRPRR